MINQNGQEFPQDHENAIQKILRPLVLELLPKNFNVPRDRPLSGNVGISIW